MDEKPAYGAIEGESATAPPSGDLEAPPPTYTSTANAPPPPSYDSIFGQIKTAREQSSGSTQFLQKFCTIVAGTIGFTIFIAILMVLPIAMIVVGALNLSNCSVQPYIPIWLVVAGSVSAFMQLCSISKKIKNAIQGKTEEDEEEGVGCIAKLNCLIGTFNFAWFIAGNVWVYSNYPPSKWPAELDCNLPTFYFSFWLITTVYIIMAILCCCSCCIAVGGKK